MAIYTYTIIILFPDDQIQLITDYEQELTELQEEVKSNSIQKKRIIYLIGTIVHSNT